MTGLIDQLTAGVVEKLSWGPNFVLCYLQLIQVFNFHSIHFTQENTLIIMYASHVKFRSDRLRTKRTKFGPHEYFPIYSTIEHGEQATKLGVRRWLLDAYLQHNTEEGLRVEEGS